MSIKMKPYERTAFYYETDQMGVIHHSNYIRWFEESRIYWMDKLGFSYKKLEDLGIMIPVLGVSCEYKNSVRFNDTVLIMPFIKEFNGFKLTVSYKIVDKETNKLMTTGESKHCFTKLDFSPCRTKRDCPEIYEIFNNSIGVDFYSDGGAINEVL